METKKSAELEIEILPLIKSRWSPRAFSEQSVPETILKEVFTAASWAASAMNEQPWHYVYAHNGTEGFAKLWACLLPGNQVWTKNAPVIFAAFYRRNYKQNGKPNKAAMHDLGMANAHLLLQAVSKGVYGHLMGGFEAEKLMEVTGESADLAPVVVGVLGYPGNPDQLDEPYRSREKQTRSRNNLEHFVVKL